MRLPSGQSLLERALETLRPHTIAQVVSGRSEAPADFAADPPVACLPDPVAHRGPATGIVVALAEAGERGCGAVLVLPVDQPALTADDLTTLVDAWREAPAQVTVATFDGSRPEPLIAIYPTSSRPALEALAAGTDRSLSRWLIRTPHRCVRLRAAARTNINTPDDWSAFHDH